MKHIRKKKIILLVSISLILVLMGNMMSVFAKSSYELEQERKKNESSLQDTKEQQHSNASFDSSIVCFVSLIVLINLVSDSANCSIK